MLARLTTSRHLLVPILAVVLLVAVSPVPAGRGNLGEPRQVCCSQVDLIIGNRTFTHMITPGQVTADVRSSLMAQVNDPNSPYNATVSTDPFDPNGVVFEVVTDLGEEVPDFQLCENSTPMTQLAVYAPMGKDAALIEKPTAMNANGTYTLTLRRWDGPAVTHTYNTSVPPNNTVSGLVASLFADLTADGFTVLEGSTYLSIRRTGDMITYVRIHVTDTGITRTCTRLVPSSGGVPTLSQYGFFLLVILMTGAAVLMLRRKSGQSVAQQDS